jgi:hypothetical protein
MIKNKLGYIAKFLRTHFRPDAIAFKNIKTYREGLIPQKILQYIPIYEEIK